MAAASRRVAAPPDTQTIARELSAENRPDSPVVEHLARQLANAFVLYMWVSRATEPGGSWRTLSQR
jgi:hypothetical protein